MSMSIDNSYSSAAGEDPITHVDEAPHDEEDDNLREEDTDDEGGDLCIRPSRIKEVVDCWDSSAGM